MFKQYWEKIKPHLNEIIKKVISVYNYENTFKEYINLNVNENFIKLEISIAEDFNAISGQLLGSFHKNLTRELKRLYVFVIYSMDDMGIFKDGSTIISKEQLRKSIDKWRFEDEDIDKNLDDLQTYFDIDCFITKDGVEFIEIHKNIKKLMKIYKQIFSYNTSDDGCFMFFCYINFYTKSINSLIVNTLIVNVMASKIVLAIFDQYSLLNNITDTDKICEFKDFDDLLNTTLNSIYDYYNIKEDKVVELEWLHWILGTRTDISERGYSVHYLRTDSKNVKINNFIVELNVLREFIQLGILD
jgi:hypothetical protein